MTAVARILMKNTKALITKDIIVSQMIDMAVQTKNPDAKYLTMASNDMSRRCHHQYTKNKIITGWNKVPYS